jgi:hypothetical protein
MTPGQGPDARVIEGPALRHVDDAGPGQVQGPEPAVRQVDVIGWLCPAGQVALNLHNYVLWQVQNSSPVIERPQEAGDSAAGESRQDGVNSGGPRP